jgi:glyoxylase-like metal-dependent hydrolase (beta-lactamase superfamily II)
MTFLPARLHVVALAIAGGAALAVGGHAIAQQNQDFSKVEIDAVQVRKQCLHAGRRRREHDDPVRRRSVMVVDTQFAPMSDKICMRSGRSPAIVPSATSSTRNMHPDHIGSNEAIAKAGRTRAGGNVVGDLGAGATSQAAVIAHENVPASPEHAGSGRDAGGVRRVADGDVRQRQEGLLFNDEAVQIIHEPSAHTDGDSLVFFRRSTCIATGDLYTTVMYPYIDAANGGTINGYINALNAILDLTVASNVNEGGTMVDPGHGRLSDEQDVIEYRDMTTIVRDRIREYVKRGLTLEQVKEKKPTLDFDPRYGRRQRLLDAGRISSRRFTSRWSRRRRADASRRRPDAITHAAAEPEQESEPEGSGQ